MTRDTGSPEPGRGPALRPGQGLAVIAAGISEDDDLLVWVTSGTRARPGLCKLYGLLWYHTRNSKRSPAGFPDLVIAGRKVLYRELKTQKGVVSPAQREWLDALTAAGQDAGVWRPEDWLSGRIERELRAAAKGSTSHPAGRRLPPEGAGGGGSAA